MMLSRFGIPRISYAQLFSFQVLYSNNADSRGYEHAGTFGLLGRKKGEWKRAILEVDYTMGTLFLHDKDRIIMCIVRDLSPQETAELGVEKGLVGVNKEVMKYGLVQRRAKTSYKKDERFLLIVPGKLLLFKGMDIDGKHVRFVTSLFGASAREELTGWIGAIEKSALFANGGLHEAGGQKSRDVRADRRRDPANTGQGDRRVVGRTSDPSLRDVDSGDSRKEAVYTNSSNNYEGGNFHRGANWQVLQRERCDANLEDPVRSRGFREDLSQSNDKNATYFRMERRSRSNFQPPSSVQSRDRDQNKAFDRERLRLDTASNNQEVPHIGNQSGKPAQFLRKEFPDQRPMDNSVMIVESADVRRREGRDFEGQAMFARQGRGPSPGQGFVSQNQAGPSGAISDCSPGNTIGWEGNHRAFEDRSTSKGPSSLQRTSVCPELSQEVPSQASSSDPAELPSKSKRHSIKELEKMIFYLNLYRKGLVDSTTQTDYG